jgi:hypothetical protein
MHVIVRQSIDDDKNDANNDDTDDDDYDNDDDHDHDRKNWIKIIDDNDDKDLSPQQKEETSLFNLRQQHPLVLIHKKKYIRRIQRELEDTDYVLLKVYNGHTYYLCQKSEM